MNRRLVQSTIVISLLIFSVTGTLISNSSDKQTNSILEALNGFHVNGIAFAQYPDTGNNSTDLGPIPEDNSTQSFPGDNGTGPIPEGNYTGTSSADIGAGLASQDNSTSASPEDNLTGTPTQALGVPPTENQTQAAPAPSYPSGTTNEDEKTAMQNSEQIIQQLQQKVDQLQKPLQSILSDLQSGQYFGSTTNEDSVTKSYDVSFTGSAVSKDSSNPSNVSGEIFLQNMITGDSIIKFKVTGGHITVGNTSYDLAFGKARVTYSSEGVKDSMTILAHGTDSNGNAGTVRLLLQASSSLEGDYGTTPVTVSVQSPESQINGNWSLSGTGQLSLVLS